LHVAVASVVGEGKQIVGENDSDGPHSTVLIMNNQISVLVKGRRRNRGREKGERV